MTTPPAPAGPDPRAGRAGFAVSLLAVVAGLVAAEYGGLALPLLAGMATGAPC